MTEDTRQNMPEMHESGKLKSHEKKPSMMGGIRQNVPKVCDLG